MTLLNFCEYIAKDLNLKEHDIPDIYVKAKTRLAQLIKQDYEKRGITERGTITIKAEVAFEDHFVDTREEARLMRTKHEIPAPVIVNGDYMFRSITSADLNTIFTYTRVVNPESLKQRILQGFKYCSYINNYLYFPFLRGLRYVAIRAAFPNPEEVANLVDVSLGSKEYPVDDEYLVPITNYLMSIYRDIHATDTEHKIQTSDDIKSQRHV